MKISVIYPTVKDLKGDIFRTRSPVYATKKIHDGPMRNQYQRRQKVIDRDTEKSVDER